MSLKPRLLLLSALFPVVCTLGAAPVWLENDYVRISVDPAAGGVTSMVYRKAIAFPLIADKGAGIAGTGLLFTPTIEVSGAAFVPRVTSIQQDRSRITLRFTAPQGLSFERRLSLGDHESAFRMEDTLRNDAAREIAVRIGTVSRQNVEPWRLAARTWIGSGKRVMARHFPEGNDAPARFENRAAPFYWRSVEQYGTGFLYTVRRLNAPVTVEQGNSREVSWKSDEIVVSGHGSLPVASTVSIDEGGGVPDQDNAAAPVLLRSDIPRAGRTGERLVGFVTVVSSAPHRVRLVAENGGHEIGSAEFELTPGKVARLPLQLVATRPGSFSVRASAFEAGKLLASASSAVVINAQPASQAWRMYDTRMPEEHYRGTWLEIGEQLARQGKRIGSPTSFEVAQRDAADSFYAKHFPFYADLVSGATRVVRSRTAALAVLDRLAPDSDACMDVAFYGPDGPINAFSKERSGTSFKGLGYVKVVPERGYAFHIYMNYGINSEGLSTSGATLNEDDRTGAAGRKAAEDWKRSGKHVVPPSVWMWLLLSMCRNVDEALAMIQNPAAPLEFTGNLLLLDRAGNAARIESAGIDRQVFRRDPGQKGFFVAGNYPHSRPNGSFGIGSRWGWAANTLLRERFLDSFAGERADRLSLLDVVTLMQSHEAGGMCQHIYDNPGHLYTSCSFIAVTRTNELWLSQGPPCQVQYVRHKLLP
jgi:hypothetical protein